ncbi:MAG: hypothetical protein H6617_01955 [Bdellovibrionaceae bacterium]|nr:hypothetical protein [Pseudobdellovibrionaceae bacterium]
MAKLSKRKELLKLIQAGKKKGFLTYQEINEAIPEEIVESDDLDSVMSLIEENNIEIVESEKKWKLLKKQAKDQKEKEAPAASEEEATRFDPFRLYFEKRWARRSPARARLKS